jgi:hypothetical protein
VLLFWGRQIDFVIQPCSLPLLHLHTLLHSGLAWGIFRGRPFFGCWFSHIDWANPTQARPGTDCERAVRTYDSFYSLNTLYDVMSISMYMYYHTIHAMPFWRPQRSRSVEKGKKKKRKEKKKKRHGAGFGTNPRSHSRFLKHTHTHTHTPICIIPQGMMAITIYYLQ